MYSLSNSAIPMKDLIFTQFFNSFSHKIQILKHFTKFYCGGDFAKLKFDIFRNKKKVLKLKTDTKHESSRLSMFSKHCHKLYRK